ncbi:MAG TPA: twin-arginine translocase subunit TatC [Gemmatimonadaceae bacterium]|nr:twin-arginine translocase subunit TatC [Gemmatimonadaceae bacterium]
MAKNTPAEMPFLDHLEELRWRLIWSLGALVVGLVLGFVIVVKFNLIRVLQQPIVPLLLGKKLVITAPGDAFSITLSAALTVGIIIASPMIIYQVWAFLSPALHRHEKKVVVPVIVGAVVLFAAGVAMAYFFVLPMVLGFLLTFQAESFDNMITASGYFSMVMTLALTFGAAFELPILILALAALGLVTPQFLARFRPYAFVLTFVVSAIVTPGDILLASLALTAPLYLLYELSVVLTRVVFRKRDRARAAALHDDSDESPIKGLA